MLVVLPQGVLQDDEFVEGDHHESIFLQRCIRIECGTIREFDRNSVLIEHRSIAQSAV